MSALPQDDRVTCVSCQFRYIRARGFCPMCGAAAPPGEPRQPATEDDSGPAKSRFPIPVVVAAVVLVCSFFLWMRSARSHGPTMVPPEPVSLPPVPAATEVVLPSPTLPPAPPIQDSKSTSSLVRKAALTTDDPDELWRRVRKGNPDAEVALARLYLEGKVVTQNCEQARLLLLAAAKRKSKAAESVLSGFYARRCR